MFFFTFAIRDLGTSVNEWHEFNRAISQMGVFKQHGLYGPFDVPFAALDDAGRKKGKAKATGAAEMSLGDILAALQLRPPAGDRFEWSGSMGGVGVLPNPPRVPPSSV